MRNLLHANSYNFNTIKNFNLELNSIEIKIKWCAIIKISILVILSVIQICVLKSFFKEKATPKV